MSGGESDEDHVVTALIERIDNGTEAEARAQALFPQGVPASEIYGGLAAVLRTP